MKNLTDQLAQYATYHRDRRNIATHLVGIPMILLALQVLLCLVVGGIGYIQYATGLPVLMISLHMLGSALVVAAAAVTWAACYARVPVGVRERLAR